MFQSSQTSQKSLEEITDGQLRQSIMNITALMDKIHNSVQKQENLFSQTDQQSSEKIKERLSRIKMSNINHKKHRKNKLSTVMEESVSFEENTQRESLFQMKENIDEDISETLDLTAVRFEQKEKIDIIKSDEYNMKKIKGIRKRKMEEHVLKPQDYLNINLHTIDLPKNKSKQLQNTKTLKSQSSKRCLGLRELVAKKDGLPSKSQKKKGLSLYCKNALSQEKGKGKNSYSVEKRGEVASAEKPKRRNIKVCAINLNKNKIQSKKEENTIHSQISLKSFGNSRKILQ